MIRNFFRLIRSLFGIVRGFFAFLVSLGKFLAAASRFIARLSLYLSFAAFVIGLFKKAQVIWEEAPPHEPKLKRKPAKSRHISKLLLAAIALGPLWSCQHAPAGKGAPAYTGPALIPVSCSAQSDLFRDDLPLENFHQAVARQTAVWNKFSSEAMARVVGHWGERSVSPNDLRDALLKLDQILTDLHDPRLINEAILQQFECYRMPGKSGRGDVLLTGYYHPLIKGALKPSAAYPYPIYRRPDDIVQADLGAFREEWKGKRLLGRLQGKTLVPYYTRQDIDQRGALKGRHLELAYVSNDLDRFFLQIQGSGSILLPDGKRFAVNYDGQNGQAYVGVGKELAKDDLLGDSEISMQNIREILDEDPELRLKYLNQNPSYVFFRPGEDGPRGSGGAMVTPRRSIATDKKLYPAGAPVFVRTHTPAFSDQAAISGWVPTTGFLIDQDTGGAIKGPGRVDLYLGEGSWAEATAGRLAHYGEVYYLLLKPARGAAVSQNVR